MGARDWMINLTVIMFVVNASLFVAMGNTNTDVFACLGQLNPSLTEIGPLTDTQSARCGVSLQNAPQNQGSVSLSDLPSIIVRLFFSLPFIGDIVQFVTLVLYVFFHVFFLGWQNIYDVLFVDRAAPVAQAFFIFGIAITGIQLFGLIDYMTGIWRDLQGR